MTANENPQPSGNEPAKPVRKKLEVSKGRLTFWIVAIVVAFYLIGSGVIGLVTGSGT
jgi:hypothetical protein